MSPWGLAVGPGFTFNIGHFFGGTSGSRISIRVSDGMMLGCIGVAGPGSYGAVAVIRNVIAIVV